MPMAMAGAAYCWSTARTGRRGDAGRCPRCIATTTTAPSRTSRREAASTWRCTAWEWRLRTTTTMAAKTFTSRHWKATGCFTTWATASSPMSRKPQGSRTRILEPAPRGWITIAMASWTCLSPTTCSGRPRTTCGARWTAPRRAIARRSRTARTTGRSWASTARSCSLDGATKSYCTPESYKGTRSRLYHNLGNGRFEDVTEKAGLGDPTSKSLGVTVLDYNNDGWPDIFVANDTQPNKLYHNLGNGTFKEEGMTAGVAYGEDGVARGAMGADAADYDRGGRQHLLVGNFSNQMLGLYHNEGNGLFVDEAPSSTVGRASLLSLSFGVFFFDYDLDGYPDIFAAKSEEHTSELQ